MKNIVWVVVSLLLLMSVPGTSHAADSPEQTSKRAQKTMLMLGALGMNNDQSRKIIKTIDGRTKNGYFLIDEENMAGGNLSLRYKLSGVRAKNLEIRYKFNDSNWQARANKERVMLEYRVQF